MVSNVDITIFISKSKFNMIFIVNLSSKKQYWNTEYLPYLCSTNSTYILNKNKVAIYAEHVSIYILNMNKVGLYAKYVPTLFSELFATCILTEIYKG